MQTAHELFLHELGDMLDAEKKLVEALGEQAEESSRPEVKKAFEMHQRQTEGQVERLQRALVHLGYMTSAQVRAGLGVFGPVTQSALAEFQSASNLPASAAPRPFASARMIQLAARSDPRSRTGPALSRQATR